MAGRHNETAKPRQYALTFDVCFLGYDDIRECGPSPSATCVFLFQAEDGIRDIGVTGVQTCALPIQAEDGIRDIGVTGVQTCALPICQRRPALPAAPRGDLREWWRR